MCRLLSKLKKKSVLKFAPLLSCGKIVLFRSNCCKSWQKKKRSSANPLSQLFGQERHKSAAGVGGDRKFAIAFGQEKIQQLVSMSASSNSACLDQFYREVPPYLVRDSLHKNSFPLCFNGFNVMYSGISKTPLWVAEALTPARLSQKIPREDNFHEETRVPSEYRAIAFRL